MKTKIILPLVLSAIIVGCGPSSNSDSKDLSSAPGTEIKVENTEKEPHHDENEAIVLDNGNKWVVVPEMMAFIKNIENDVKELEKNSKATLNDHKHLATLIDDNLEKLTSNCTMTGQGHDELHKWLLPFLDLSGEYLECTTEENAKATYNKINSSFETLNIYFK